jgi:hypothetical protein
VVLGAVRAAAAGPANELQCQRMQAGARQHSEQRRTVARRGVGRREGAWRARLAAGVQSAGGGAAIGAGDAAEVERAAVPRLAFCGSGQCDCWGLRLGFMSLAE